MRLRKSYYLKDDVVYLAKNLLGKILFVNIDGNLSAGIISETEAYEGITDKASHAYNGRKTQRTEVLFREGGIAYVYLIYGIYHLFNIVTNKKDIPHAILLRGIIPLTGIEYMEQRLGKSIQSYHQSNGPGKASMCLGIKTFMTGESLSGKNIWIEDHRIRLKENEIGISKRIGIDYAEEDVNLPYRFYIKNDWIKRNYYA